jgi:hypothetical protein
VRAGVGLVVGFEIAEEFVGSEVVAVSCNVRAAVILSAAIFQAERRISRFTGLWRVSKLHHHISKNRDRKPEALFHWIASLELAPTVTLDASDLPTICGPPLAMW